MAQIEFRMNLQSKIFPLLTQLQGQTVIIPERDQTYVPNVNPTDDQNSVDRGIPGLLYAHNVMPSAFGWQSVGFLPRVTSTLPNDGTMDSIVQFPRTTNGYSTLVTINRTTGRLCVLNEAGVWKQIASPSIGPGAVLSVATVNGISHLCISNVGVYRISMATEPVVTQVTTKGLDQSNILGIFSSSGYMLAWSATGLAWSSTSDPLDFEPSDETGAGAGDIQDAAGDIIWCQDTSYGAIIYTRGNAVQATWSGNVNFPWNFRGIPSSGGVESGRVVSKEANGQHWVYTSKGLQQIYHTGAKTVLPFITDFLSGKEIDDWPAGATWPVVYSATSSLKKALSYVGDRYLVLSYSLPTAPQFTHALIFDTIQLRIGKLRHEHVQAFEISASGADDTEAARDNLGLVDKNGRIYSVDFRLTSQTHQGFIVLGKFQVARGYMSQLIKVNMENVNEGAGLPSHDVVAFQSMDGKNPSKVLAGHDNSSGGEYVREYLWHHWGKNHSIGVSGSFNLISIELTLNVEMGR